MKAIGFDYGGTLAYSPMPKSWKSHYNPALTAAFKSIYKEAASEEITCGLDVLEKYNTRINPRINEISSNVIFTELLQACGYSSADLDMFSSAFFKYFEKDQLLFDNVIPFLTWLKKKKIPSGIFTNVAYGKCTDLINQELSAFNGFSNLFSIILTTVDAGERKPSPHGLLRLAEQLKIKIEDMIYAGNEECDIQSAHSAGCMAIYVARNNEIPQWEQDLTVRNLSKLKRLFI